MYVWLAFVIVVLSFCLYIRHWLRYRRTRSLAAVFPGWRTVPLLGNTLDLIGGQKVLFRRFIEMGEIAERHNTMFKLWLGPQLLLTEHTLSFLLFKTGPAGGQKLEVYLMVDSDDSDVITVTVGHKPDDMRAITNAFIEKPHYYHTFGKEYVGNGLITAPTSTWKRNVKFLTATFAGSVVDGFQDIYNRQAAKLAENLASEIGRPPFDAMKKYLGYATLETICQTAMGVPDISGSIITSEYCQAFNRILELILARTLNILLHPEWIYQLTPGYRELMKNIAVLHQVSKTVIERRRRERNQTKTNNINLDSADTLKSKFRPFLDVLIEQSETDPLLTDDQIRAEVDTVIAAGQETTATTLLFTMLMLGCHHQVQDKLYQEIKRIFGDSKRPITKEDLAEMKYCEAVIYETLRLFPPVPAVMRSADTDVKLDGYVVPAGAFCVINALGAGRSQRNWGADADQYRPERWLENPPSNSAVFLTFSYGRRACIGKRYALAALKTMLAWCVRELEFTSNGHNMELAYGLTLRPHSNYLMQVKLRC